MSYMRFGKKLRWFDSDSKEYIYRSEDKLVDWKRCISGKDGNEQWIELIGRMLYRETQDREFCNVVVEKLARTYKVSNKLRPNYIHPMGYEGD